MGHPWAPAWDEFNKELLPKLLITGKKVGERARAGNKLCLEIIGLYDMLHKSFDPLTYLCLKEKFDEYIKSIEGIEGNICPSCGAKAGPYHCGGCGAT